MNKEMEKKTKHKNPKFKDEDIEWEEKNLRKKMEKNSRQKKNNREKW